MLTHLTLLLAQTDTPTEESGGTPNGDTDAAANIADMLTQTYDKTTLVGWAVLLGGIFVGLAAGKIVGAVLGKLESRARERNQLMRATILHDAAHPLSLALFTVGLTVGLIYVHMSDEVAAFVGDVLNLFYIGAVGWFLFNLVDLVDLAMRRKTEQSANKLAVQLVPLVRKTLRVFLVVILILFVAQNIFEQDITAWIAGLGLFGLAIALAAQDSIKNLIGSMTVLLDHPFAVGDRIQFNGADGFVEELGFRSTKVRTFTGHLITIPNMKFIDGTIENVSARPFLRRMLDVTITYDTPPEKIEQAIQIAQDILHAEDMAAPFDFEERPPRVYFSDYNDASLNISVMYWYMLDESQGRDWWGYLAYNDEFNRRLFKAYNEAGIDFAFPTQTLHLANDDSRQLAVRLLRDSNTEPTMN